MAPIKNGYPVNKYLHNRLLLKSKRCMCQLLLHTFMPLRICGHFVSNGLKGISVVHQLWPPIAQQRPIMPSFKVLCEKCFWHTAAPQPGNELLYMSICSEHLRQMGDTLKSRWPLRFPKEQQAYLKWQITPMLIFSSSSLLPFTL